MASTVTAFPPSIGLSKQGLYVTINSDRVDTDDRTNWVFQPNGTPPFDFSANEGESITISWDGNSVTFTVAADPDESGTQIPLYVSGSFTAYRDLVLEYMLKNELIYDNFYTEIGDGGGIAYIIFYYHTQDPVEVTLEEDMAGVVAFTNNSTGPIVVDNLSCVLKVIEYDQDNNESLAITLNAPFNTSNGNAVFEIGQAFNLEPHLPSAATIFVNLLGYTYGVAEKAYRKYLLKYAERFGTPPVTQGLQEDKTYHVIYGGYSFNGRATFGTNVVFGQVLCHNYRYADGSRWYKPVSKEQPDWTYVFTKQALNDCVINVVVYFEDGTSTEFPYPDLDPFNLLGSHLYWFPSGYGQLRLDEVPNPDNLAIVRYEWRLKPESGSLVHARVGYDVDCECHPWNIYLLFENGLGGCESVRLMGKTQQKYVASRETFRRTRWQDVTVATGEEGNYFQEGNQQWEANTGWHPEYYIRHLRQLLLGDAWLIDLENERFIKIIINTESIEDVDDDQELFALNFNFRMAGYDRAFNFY